jgi:hypothetical protein
MKLQGVISFVATLIPLLLIFVEYRQTDDSLCYIKTGSGTTFDLSSVSGGNRHISLQPIVNQKEKLSLQDVHLIHKGDLTNTNMLLTGKIVNESNDTQSIDGLIYHSYHLPARKLVTVSYDFIDTGYDIPPGESVSFEFKYYVPGGYTYNLFTLTPVNEKIKGDAICFGNSVENREYCKRISNYVRCI